MVKRQSWVMALGSWAVVLSVYGFQNERGQKTEAMLDLPPLPDKEASRAEVEKLRVSQNIPKAPRGRRVRL